MRTFRPARLLLIPAVALPLLASTVITAGPSWAKVGAKPVVCRTVGGTVGAWSLEGCNQPAITGGGSTTIDNPFSPGTTGATISWAQGALRGPSADTSTVTVSVFATVKNKCSAGSTEYEMLGTVTGNNFSPALKLAGKVKILACASIGGTLSNTVKGRLLTAKL